MSKHGHIFIQSDGVNEMGMAIGRPGLKTLYIMEILLQRTDEQHALNASQILDILKSEYGITSNRQTIYSEIAKLEESDLDIVKLDGKFGGYYVASRRFELPELKLMVDAVQSSRFITRKKSQELIRKLETLCSREEARQLSSQVVVYNRPKTLNETIYYNVDRIHSAIYHNLQITFQYADWTVKKEMVLRHDGAFYVASPLRLIWDDENYYLIAYDEKSQSVKHYRVDKMRSMSIFKEERSKEALAVHIDPAVFSKKTFGMFSGEDVQVRLYGKNELAGVILDRFGSDIVMVPADPEHFSATVTVTVSQQFFGWITAVGKDLKIAAPEDVKRQYYEYLKGILEENPTTE